MAGHVSLKTITLVEGNPAVLEVFDLTGTILNQWQETPELVERTVILVQNTGQQKILQNALCEAIQQPLNHLPVFTFNGFIRHSLQRLWVFAEAKLQSAFPEANALTRLLPEAVGLEESERLFRLLIEQFKTKQTEAFERLNMDEASLIRQLIRRQRLRAEQRLSREQMHALDATLKIPEIALIHQLERAFEQSTLKMRCLDSTKQMDVVLGLLEEHPDYVEHLEAQADYLVWTNADESTPAEQQLIRLLSGCSQHMLITWDAAGSARRGYLNADLTGAIRLIEDLKGKAEEIIERVQAHDTPEENTYHLGDALCHVLTSQDENPFETMRHIQPKPHLVLHPPQRCLMDMWDAVCTHLLAHSPEDVVLVLPEVSSLLLTPLKRFLHQQKIPFQVLSGTQRPVDTLEGKLLLLLIQVLHSHEWQLPLSRFEWRTVLTAYLHLQESEAPTLDAFCDFITQHALLHISQGVNQGISGANSLPRNVPSDLLKYEASRKRYLAFCDALLDLHDAPLETQLLAVSHQWIYPHLTVEQPDTALQLIMRSWQRQLKMLESLNVPLVEGSKQWLWQAKYGKIADTADAPQALQAEALLIATPQKVIDFNVKRPVQYWLDSQSPRWVKTDEAPLYHTGIHSPQGWQRLQAQDEVDTIMLTEIQRRERAGHLLRKVAFGASEAIHVFTSELDAEGREQSQLQPLLYQALTQSLSPLTQSADLNAIPTAPLRDDQSAVLKYQAGTLAISAVPGAGKTFVTVELILHLIKQGMPPNAILVLTYMESAARTVMNRLKPKLMLAGVHQLPMVCTIHALAFKLLSESNHARRIGLESTHFRMVDETEQVALLKQAGVEVFPLASAQKDMKIEDWQNTLNQVIQHAKSLELTWADLAEDAEKLKHPVLHAMAMGMKRYQQLLTERNALDFTDLIVYAVQLLEAHDDIRQLYQAQFQVIMEDEAQDSSRLLQRFLSLLGGDTPNLVRCGDTNQSITTTFSSAEPEVFRRFMQSADAHVRMTTSGRCAVEIMALANHWIKVASVSGQILENAFLPVEMKGLDGVNPTLLEPIHLQSFQSEAEEMESILHAIERLQAKHPNATFAVLLRYNRDVLRFTERLLERGISAFSHTERLPNQEVFQLVNAWLGALLYSEQAEHRLHLLHTLRQVEAHPLHVLADEDFIALRDIVASLPLFALSVADVQTLSPLLQQLYYDWHDYQRDLASRDLPSFLLRLVDDSSPTLLDRCNGYLCALHAQCILERYGLGITTTEAQQLNLLASSHSVSPLEVVHRHFQVLSKNRKNVQLFTEELLNPTTKTNVPHEITPPVQVMTLHKSKGMEFDFVWMPALTQANFPDTLDLIKVKSAEEALIGIQRLAEQRRNPKAPLPPLGEAVEAFKRQHLEEEARLLYVGFTRAMRGLSVSTHHQHRNHFNRLVKSQPTYAFHVIQDFLEALVKQKESEGATP